MDWQPSCTCQQRDGLLLSDSSHSTRFEGMRYHERMNMDNSLHMYLGAMLCS